jgi:4-hydroxybenzoate polyprenyltransferase
MLFRKNPMYIFISLLWLIRGKVYFKNKVFEKVLLRYELLPYNKKLLSFLSAESAKDRKLVLATASLKSHALEIAKIHPIFTDVHGTEQINLKGTNKLKILIDEYGESNFDYIGDSHADLEIFASSRYSYLVNPSKSLERRTRKVSDLKHVWKSKKLHLRDYIKAIRAYQWIKNVLIFVPLITSHSFYSINIILQATGAFFAFSFAASAGYVINDLLDLNSDRAHPRKQFRPFASGRLSIPQGVLLAIIFLSAGVFLASQLSMQFLGILLLYFVISFSYSLYFKKIVLYDVFILALLYSSRVIAGGLVTNIAISFWLIAFSTFIFLSLAFVKRYSELMKINTSSGLKERGREYTTGDLNLLQVMGIVSGFLSVVVFSLYIDSPEVAQLYAHPKVLWTISLLFLFWISRIWIITNRGDMTDDPIVFTIKDATSYIIFLIIGLIIWMSM